MKKPKYQVWMFGGPKEGHYGQGENDDVTRFKAVMLYRKYFNSTATREVCLEEFRGVYHPLVLYKKGPNGEPVCISDDEKRFSETAFEVREYETKVGMSTNSPTAHKCLVFYE